MIKCPANSKQRSHHDAPCLPAEIQNFPSAQKPTRNKAAFEPFLERAPEEIVFHGQYQAE